MKADGADGLMAKKVYVETGESFEGEIVISEGLDGTEEIVADGARSLTDKDLIKVEPKG